MPNPELVTYISQELKRGIQPDQISATLIAKGWNPEDVQKALAQFNVPINAPRTPYYVGTMPVESVSQHPGRMEGIISIICAVISILFFPVIFGPVGIILGIVAFRRGAKTIGIVGIILSLIFMIAGFVIGYIVQSLFPESRGSVLGAILPFLTTGGIP